MAPSLSFASTMKLDPMLTLIIQKGSDMSIPKRHGILKSVPDSEEPFIETLVRFKEDLLGVGSLGGRIRSILGDVATVDIPLSAIESISQLPNIIYIEAAKPVKSRLDVSVPDTRADLLLWGTPPGWSGNTGRNVIIGIVDSGIDLNHDDFKDSSGMTRILFLWDQGATIGSPPSGYTYGNECTKTVIEMNGCPQNDSNGHGTHVAGIAAGDGSAAGNGEPPFQFMGMAPEADLIIVRSMNQNVALETAIIDGISYIQSKAAGLGKPSVINLSLGSQRGPHDGTSSYERALDNASGLGRVIVGAGGNEAEAFIHASGTVTQSGFTSVGFTIPSGSSSETLDIWYAGADQMGLSATNGICTTGLVNPGMTQTFDTACGQIAIGSSGINPLNGDREIIVDFSDGSNPLLPGGWAFTLSGFWIAGHCIVSLHERLGPWLLKEAISASVMVKSDCNPARLSQTFFVL